MGVPMLTDTFNDDDKAFLDREAQALGFTGSCRIRRWKHIEPENDPSSLRPARGEGPLVLTLGVEDRRHLLHGNGRVVPPLLRWCTVGVTHAPTGLEISLTHPMADLSPRAHKVWEPPAPHAISLMEKFRAELLSHGVAWESLAFEVEHDRDPDVRSHAQRIVDAARAKFDPRAKKIEKAAADACREALSLVQTPGLKTTARAKWEREVMALRFFWTRPSSRTRKGSK